MKEANPMTMNDRGKNIMAIYNFEVKAVINKNLPSGKQNLARAELKKWQEKLQITAHNVDLYSWNQPQGHNGNEEFGFIRMFFYQLKKNKDCFSVLEYIDNIDDENENALEQ